MPTLRIPALVHDWNQYGNVVVPRLQGGSFAGSNQAGLVWVTMKDILRAIPSPGIICSGSSDSVTAAMDGADRILTHNNIVTAVAGTAHSWFVFRNQANGMQILWDWSTTHKGFAEIRCSPGGLFTGGSITARPTATDEISNITGSFSWLAAFDTVTRFTIHVWHRADGQSTRVLILSGRFLIMHMFLERVASRHPEWTNNNVIMIDAAAAVSEGIHAYTRLMNNAGRFKGVDHLGVPMLMQGLLRGCLSSVPVIAHMATVNHALNGSSPLEQLGLWGVTTGRNGAHGKLEDFWLCSTMLPTGEIIQDVTDPSRRVLVAGNYAHPWLLGEEASAT